MTTLGTNYEIVDLLLKQTYQERMEMAEAFRDYIENEFMENNPKIPDVATIAQWFDAYTDSLPYD